MATSNDPKKPAVFGENTANHGVGVHGKANTGEGVFGESVSGRGVHGLSQAWQGVFGKSTSNAGVVGESDTLHGVFGVCHNPHGAGVFGTNTQAGGFGVQGINDSGDGVTGKGRRGVVGESQTFQGVFGWSFENAGVVGESTNLHGVFGVCHNPHGAGVFGTNDKTGGIGVHGVNELGDGIYGKGRRGVVGESDTFQGVFGKSIGNAGVVGESDNLHGVFGVCHNPNGGGVFGTNNKPGGSGVIGISDAGIGVFGRGGVLAGRFEGDVEVTGDLRIPNADCAEDFDVAAPATIEPGTVMVLGEKGALCESHKAYDKRVAGVISGAGSCRPGIVLDCKQERVGRKPIALLGKVFCKVDAGDAAIEIGDLLTTSALPGHAMKASDQSQAFGAVIGKALQPLTHGRGLIAILVALQ
jgi:hypothetical protein